MKFTRNGSVQVVAGVIAGAGLLVVACGADEGTASDTTSADASAEGAASSSGTTSSTSSSSSSSSTSSSSGGGDGGESDAAKGGGDGGGGTVANGGDCKAAADCQSGVCWKETYCTIACTMKDQTDPVCQALKGNFTGKCNKQGFCQMN